MNTVPDEYVPLDVDTVGEFASSFLPGPADAAEEIGDGNLNLVFRVRSGAESVIVKQALPYLKIAGEGWPLTLDRVRIEAEALRIQADLAPGRVPALIAHRPARAAIVLEDLSEHVVWRTALIAGHRHEGVAEALGEFCARTLVGTSPVTLDSERRATLHRQFVNPELCAITEDLVFTSPYVDSASNRYDPEIADLAAELRADVPLRAAAGRLKLRFQTRAEALIHGDLHTGSVMVRDGGDPRAIDPEFAFLGPMGFDIGNVLANLAMARTAHAALGDASLAAWLDDAAARFSAAFADTFGACWPSGVLGGDRQLADVLADAAGYAGVEMIRRQVGLAHAADIDTLPDGMREEVRRAVIAAGRVLITAARLHSHEELWSLATGETCS